MAIGGAIMNRYDFLSQAINPIVIARDTMNSPKNMKLKYPLIRLIISRISDTGMHTAITIRNNVMPM